MMNLIEFIRQNDESRAPETMQDWSDPQCGKCYHYHIHVVTNGLSPFACEGSLNMCLHYHPPLKAEFIAQNQRIAEEMEDNDDKLIKI